MQRTEIETQLIEKAESDPAFRQSLIADPRAAVERLAGQPLPDGVTITVVEETPTALYLVLPPLPKSELSDADLADISGGAGGGKSEERPTLSSKKDLEGPKSIMD